MAQGHKILILVSYLWHRNTCPSVPRGTRKHSTRRTHRGTRLTKKQHAMTQETCCIHLYGFLSVRPIVNACFSVNPQDIVLNVREYDGPYHHFLRLHFQSHWTIKPGFVQGHTSHTKSYLVILFDRSYKKSYFLDIFSKKSYFSYLSRC